MCEQQNIYVVSLIISWPFIFSLLLALTVRFLTKRFIGEYQSIMRKYIIPTIGVLFIYFEYLPKLFKIFRHFDIMIIAVAMI